MNEVLKNVFIAIGIILVLCICLVLLGALATGNLIDIFSGGAKKSNHLYKLIKIILLICTSFFLVNYIKLMII